MSMESDVVKVQAFTIIYTSAINRHHFQQTTSFDEVFKLFELVISFVFRSPRAKWTREKLFVDIESRAVF